LIRQPLRFPRLPKRCQSERMRLFRRKNEPEPSPEPDDDVSPTDTYYDDYEPSWYVPHDGDNQRFVGPDGLPALHLIPYTDSADEHVLRLCEDSTGLLIGPADKRLPHAGVYVSQLRGEFYHPIACKAGDFLPGRPITLFREPANEYDGNAVAVYDATGTYHAAYVNKQKARILAKLIAAGETLHAISIRGTPPGIDCEQIAILAARPHVLARLTSPRPDFLPSPAHLRRTAS
jgi:HIRAN domain